MSRSGDRATWCSGDSADDDVARTRSLYPATDFCTDKTRARTTALNLRPEQYSPIFQRETVACCVTYFSSSSLFIVFMHSESAHAQALSSYIPIVT